METRWPLKIVESLAAGLPVVTGAIGDRAEMLGNGAAGRLVQPGSAAALATAMGEILDDPGGYKAMKVACRPSPAV
ncbi:MAG: glycosyltransferase [Caldilineaceae bacterium]